MGKSVAKTVKEDKEESTDPVKKVVSSTPVLRCKNVESYLLKELAVTVGVQQGAVSKRVSSAQYPK